MTKKIIIICFTLLSILSMMASSQKDENVQTIDEFIDEQKKNLPMKFPKAEINHKGLHTLIYDKIIPQLTNKSIGELRLMLYFHKKVNENSYSEIQLDMDLIEECICRSLVLEEAARLGFGFLNEKDSVMIIMCDKENIARNLNIISHINNDSVSVNQDYWTFIGSGGDLNARWSLKVTPDTLLLEEYTDRGLKCLYGVDSKLILP